MAAQVVAVIVGRLAVLEGTRVNVNNLGQRTVESAGRTGLDNIRTVTGNVAEDGLIGASHAGVAVALRQSLVLEPTSPLRHVVASSLARTFWAHRKFAGQRIYAGIDRRCWTCKSKKL